MGAFENLGQALKRGGSLHITCRNCGVGAVWPAKVALARLGGGAAPFDVRRRMRCGYCGKKDYSLVVE